MLLPEDLALGDVDCVEVVVDVGHNGHFARSTANVQTADDEGREECVQLTDVIIELQFPKRLHTAHGGLTQDLLVSLPASPPRVITIGQPIGCRKYRASGQNC